MHTSYWNLSHQLSRSVIKWSKSQKYSQNHSFSQSLKVLTSQLVNKCWLNVDKCLSTVHMSNIIFRFGIISLSSKSNDLHQIVKHQILVIFVKNWKWQYFGRIFCHRRIFYGSENFFLNYKFTQESEIFFQINRTKIEKYRVTTYFFLSRALSFPIGISPIGS